MPEPLYDAAQLAQLRDGYYAVDPSYQRLREHYVSLRLTTDDAYEYVRHGFVCRLGTLKRCIENVYSTYPPERSDTPSGDELTDLEINLQSFLFNVFGCIDNLAHIWVKEKNIRDKQGRPLRDQQIGLRGAYIAVRETLSPEFQKYLVTREDWFSYLEDYRHALAHRIPLYVPPYILHPDKFEEHKVLERQKEEAHIQHNFSTYDEVNTEQKNLGRFKPWITHSYTEDSKSLSSFHYQMLIDWNSVVEMADEFLQELRSR